ncbi:MAG: preprotein translocase subunit SecE [Agathobaculum sp.]|jgi:preprotein translocase subunit SecE|uniref:preprotein translocase subunit SecE n=1 Tax=Agathobaculum sp. TaxID=2048138 RepID=UPI003D907DDE
MAEETKVKKPSLFARIGKWFRELKSECRKIVWPTRQQTVNNTLVVVACVIVVGIFIWVLDVIFGLGVQALITHFAA